MFLDLDFVERFHIDYEVLCRWLLSVKKNYRNVTYHNWRHAFNVAQMMFAILTVRRIYNFSSHLMSQLNSWVLFNFINQVTQWWKIFGEIECLALIIACLCHDLDHRGTNNSFQIKWVLIGLSGTGGSDVTCVRQRFLTEYNLVYCYPFLFWFFIGSAVTAAVFLFVFWYKFFLFRASSPLAQLYSTSTMEHHHFDQCIMILNSQGNQILGNVSSDEYARIIKILEDAILSTDLAVYFRYSSLWKLHWQIEHYLVFRGMRKKYFFWLSFTENEELFFLLSSHLPTTGRETTTVNFYEPW